MTNKQTRRFYKNLSFFRDFLQFLSKLSITNEVSREGKKEKEPRHSFIKIFIIMMCGES